MSSRKSKKHSTSAVVKNIIIEAAPPAIIVVTRDKIQRLKDCNPDRHFNMLLFYFGLLFSCGLVYLTLPDINKASLIILISATAILATLVIVELFSYRKKQKLFDTILNEIERAEGKLL